MQTTSGRKPQIWHNEDEDSESPCLLRPAAVEPAMVTQQSLGPLHLRLPEEAARPPVDRVLSRMSSVTLLENEANSMRTPEPRQLQPQLRVQQIIIDDDDEDSSASSTSTPAPPSPPSPPAAPRRSNRLDMLLDTVLASEEDDENRPYTPNVGDIPLNCMTQERVYHPRKRPAPSPASGMRGYQNGVQYSWKRHTSHTENDSVKRSLEGMESISIQTPDSTPSSTPSEASSSSDMKPERMELSPSSPSSRKGDTVTGTLIVYQPTCLDHHNDTHQENRQRLTTLCGPEGVLHKDRFKDLKWADLTQLRPARLNDLLRVHTFEYIGHLEKVVSALPEQIEDYSVGRLFDNKTVRGPLAHSDWIQTDKAQKVYGVENPPSSGSLDMDSPISKSSYMAARLAAGAVCHAIDKVLNHETKNAFVIVRPPGHHAGPNGCVDSEGFHRRPEMCTCGFCLLNNVAIGAAYAMSTYCAPYYTAANPDTTSQRLQQPAMVERIAIVDFDIHHGNGTEDVVRNLVPHKQNYPLPPSWSPLQFSSYKPWRDEKDPENVMFASIHLYDEDNFYPCSGQGPHGCSPELRDNKNIVNMPLDVLGPSYLEERLKMTAKAKKQLMQQASEAFRKQVTETLIPSLKKFRPDLIMLSAGFDGHADDFYYFLSEDDYGWITEQIAAVADECCDGRMVSVLEGGYNVVPDKSQKPKATKKSVMNSNFHHAAKLHNREVDSELLPYGSLARSCASHVSALLDASHK